jgi:hypothetical protein
MKFKVGDIIQYEGLDLSIAHYLILRYRKTSSVYQTCIALNYEDGITEEVIFSIHEDPCIKVVA